MRHLSLFSGIGGIDLAAEWAGFQTVAFCEKDKFCQDVLHKHWPKVPIHEDIHRLTKEALIDRGIAWPTAITGGFPCQPFSLAGKGLAERDPRHLWPQMLRVISEVRPAWVVGENVAGLTSKLAFESMLVDLEAEGYDVQPVIIPACAVGAWHQRARIFILAYTERRGCEAWGPTAGRQAGSAADGLRGGGWRTEVAGLFDAPNAIDRGHGESIQPQRKRGRGQSPDVGCDGEARFISDAPIARSRQLPDEGRLRMANPDRDREGVSDTIGDKRYGRSGDVQMGRQRSAEEAAWSCDPGGDQWRVEPAVGRVAHGISRRVDRLRGLGNAVVPQQIYPVLQAIADMEMQGGSAK